MRIEPPVVTEHHVGVGHAGLGGLVAVIAPHTVEVGAAEEEVAALVAVDRVAAALGRLLGGDEIERGQVGIGDTAVELRVQRRVVH